MTDLLLKNARCVLPNGTRRAHVAVMDGKITAVLGPDEALPKAREVMDLDGLVLLPGIIDSQVHFREPGLTHKEDLGTGSQAAALGGVCTYLEMPNTKPATDTAERIAEKVALGKAKSHVNFGFFLGATGKNIEHIANAHKMEGCCGVKIFLGSSTGDLLLYAPEKLLDVFKKAQTAISLHSEDEERLRERQHIRDGAKSAHAHPDWRDVGTALNSTQKVIALAREAKKRVHVLHVTTAEEIEFLARNKDICTVEITPQHLTLAAPDCYDRLGTYAQMNPPIRDARHREALWGAVVSGVADVIGSDHAPHTREEKDKGYPQAPSGMPGVQTILPIMLDAVHRRKITLERMVELLSSGPAKLFNLAGKGIIAQGMDADFTVVDTEAQFTIKNEDQASRVGWTPFDGMKVQGRPMMTIVGGQLVMREGQLLACVGKPVRLGR